MAREMLNDETLENVVGGVFQFYKGGTRCKVQGQKFQCDASGQFQMITLINANPDKNEAELLQLALAAGILKPL
ncbi:MAG: hypothetical protein II875_10745 [Clostridia bacterium]|nr:hypothetical protein [Clostridia bacterium]